MTLDVTLRYSGDGTTCVYHDTFERPDPPEVGDLRKAFYSELYIWMEGNYSCDCNRMTFMCQVLEDAAPAALLGSDYDREDGEGFRCGDGVIELLKITWHETGEILWDSESDPE